MAKFVRFTDSLNSRNGPAEQSVYINPEHVRIVRKDYEYGGGSVIGLVDMMSRSAKTWTK